MVGIAQLLLFVRQFLLCRGELFFESGDLAEYDFVVLLVGSQLRIECCILRFNLNAFARKVFDHRCQTFHATLGDGYLLTKLIYLTLLILEVGQCVYAPFGEHTSVFIGTDVPGAAIAGNRVAAVQAPTLVHSCERGVKLSHSRGKLVFVTACKYLLEGEFLVANRHHGAAYVRSGFIKIHIKTDNVFLSVAVAHKGVNILRPFLNLGRALQTEVVLVEAGLIVHLLVAESELTHLVAAAAQNKVGNADARCFGLS